MRRFVVMNSSGEKIGEGVEQVPGGPAYRFKTLFHRDGQQGQAIRSFGSVQEIVDGLSNGEELRFLDWHTTDEAFKLVPPGE
jgi:hypothetical protein